MSRPIVVDIRYFSGRIRDVCFNVLLRDPHPFPRLHLRQVFEIYEPDGLTLPVGQIRKLNRVVQIEQYFGSFVFSESFAADEFRVIGEQRFDTLRIVQRICRFKFAILSVKIDFYFSDNNRLLFSLITSLTIRTSLLTIGNYSVYTERKYFRKEIRYGTYVDFKRL